MAISFPYDKPDKNGVVYSKEAIERAVKQMPTNLPISFLDNNPEHSEKIIGYTESAPYAIQSDKDGNVKFTIDGRIFFGGTACTVNKMDSNGVIEDFEITSVGISL